jgi:hypothetical protein
VGLLAKEQYVIDVSDGWMDRSLSSESRMMKLSSNPAGLGQVYKKHSGRYLMGIFYGGHGQLLLCQFISVVVSIAWVVSAAHGCVPR